MLDKSMLPGKSEDETFIKRKRGRKPLVEVWSVPDRDSYVLPISINTDLYFWPRQPMLPGDNDNNEDTPQHDINEGVLTGGACPNDESTAKNNLLYLMKKPRLDGISSVDVSLELDNTNIGYMSPVGGRRGARQKHSKPHPGLRAIDEELVSIGIRKRCGRLPRDLRQESRENLTKTELLRREEDLACMQPVSFRKVSWQQVRTDDSALAVHDDNFQMNCDISNEHAKLSSIEPCNAPLTSAVTESAFLNFESTPAERIYERIYSAIISLDQASNSIQRPEFSGGLTPINNTTVNNFNVLPTSYINTNLFYPQSMPATYTYTAPTAYSSIAIPSSGVSAEAATTTTITKATAVSDSAFMKTYLFDNSVTPMPRIAASTPHVSMTQHQPVGSVTTTVSSGDRYFGDRPVSSLSLSTIDATATNSGIKSPRHLSFSNVNTSNEHSPSDSNSNKQRDNGINDALLGRFITQLAEQMETKFEKKFNELEERLMKAINARQTPTQTLEVQTAATINSIQSGAIENKIAQSVASFTTQTTTVRKSFSPTKDAEQEAILKRTSVVLHKSPAKKLNQAPGRSSLQTPTKAQTFNRVDAKQMAHLLNAPKRISRSTSILHRDYLISPKINVKSTQSRTQVIKSMKESQLDRKKRLTGIILLESSDEETPVLENKNMALSSSHRVTSKRSDVSSGTEILDTTTAETSIETSFSEFVQRFRPIKPVLSVSPIALTEKKKSADDSDSDDDIFELGVAELKKRERLRTAETLRRAPKSIEEKKANAESENFGTKSERDNKLFNHSSEQSKRNARFLKQENVKNHLIVTNTSTSAASTSAASKYVPPPAIKQAMPSQRTESAKSRTLSNARSTNKRTTKAQNNGNDALEELKLFQSRMMEEVSQTAPMLTRSRKRLAPHDDTTPPSVNKIFDSNDEEANDISHDDIFARDNELCPPTLTPIGKRGRHMRRRSSDSFN